MNKGASVHGGLRTKLFGTKDYEIDNDVVGFHRIEAREIDDIGVDGIVKRTLDVVGDNPVYLSIDIDGRSSPENERAMLTCQCSFGPEHCTCHWNT